MCAYLALPGSSLLHPFPIFICIRFSPDIVKELKSTSLNYIEAANIRYLCNTTSYDKLDNQVKSLLLTSTDNTSTKNWPQTSSQIYGAFASGVNVYLNSHSDRDFTFSAVTIRTKDAYTPNQKIVAYFTFPRLGVAVPLRPGDVLF